MMCGCKISFTNIKIIQVVNKFKIQKFQIPNSKFQIPNSKFQKFQIPNSKIQKFKIQK